MGYSQLALDVNEDDAIGVSLDADFDNGFRAILNWIDMGDAGSRDVDEQYIGVGLGYAMDAKAAGRDRWEIHTRRGRKPTGIDAVKFARIAAAKGAGEILLTSMDRDGARDGFDIPLTRAIADSVDIPMIASGGVGTLDHLVEGVRDGRASAVLAASIFHFGDHSIREAKERMAAAGIPVRLP